MLRPLTCVPRGGNSPTMLRPLACAPRDGDSPMMLRQLACRPRDGWHPMPDSHPEITIIRCLEEAHSSVTPGQDAKRTQPGDSSEQGKSASKRLTSISDAHSQRGPCRQSLVCGAPRRCPSYAQQNNYTLNVGTYLGASASEEQSMRCPVSKGTRVVGVFYPIAIKP